MVKLRGLLQLAAVVLAITSCTSASAQTPSPASAEVNDETNPIPYLDRLDVYAINKNGGATLVIVVATPLPSDPRSQKRLLDKIEGYLGFIHTAEFAKETGGPPTPDKVKIQVTIHPDSDRLIFQLLENCKAWVTEAGATLEVRAP